MSRAQNGVDRGTEALLVAVLTMAASRDLVCLRAGAVLRDALKSRPGTPESVETILLDDCRRALTQMAVALEPAARSRVEGLAPFSRQLAETGAIAALDEEALGAFLRPIFEDAGIGARFAPSSAAGGATAPGRTTALGRETAAPAIELVPVALDAEALFDHLLTNEETISYVSAYLAMLGPVGPWRSLLHVPMVLQVARGTAMRVAGTVRVRLDALIVNKKTRVPGRRHFIEHAEYSEEAWIRQFGRWSACDHPVSEIREGKRSAAATPTLPPVAEEPVRTAPIANASAEQVVDAHTPPEDAPAADLPRPAAPPTTVALPAFSAPPTTVALPAPSAPPTTEALPAASPATMALPGASAAPTLGRADPGVRSGSARALHRALMLVAAGRTVVRIAFACLAAIVLGSLVGSAVSSLAAPRPAPDVDAPVAPGLAIHDTFGAIPLDSDPGWETSAPGGSPGSARVVPWPTSIDRSVRVQGGAADQSVTACRPYPAVRSGPMVMEARIFVDGFNRSDTTIVSIRSGAFEAAGLRIDPRGEILGQSESGAPTGAARMAPNVWHKLSVVLDVTNRTYGLTMWRSDPPALLGERAGGWIAQLDGGIDRICFTAPGGPAAPSVLINELKITAP